MPANYLHGAEVIEITKGSQPIRVVKSAVIGLVGIAPIGPKNTLTLVTSPKDAEQFGDELPGFDIPQSLRAIFDQGYGTVLVVNTFDDDANTDAVVDEVVTVEDGAFKTAAPPVVDAPVVTNTGGLTTYVLDTHYTYDSFGNFTIIDRTTIPDGTSLKVDYTKLEVTEVTAAQIIGDIDEDTNERTGLKCFELAYNTFGFSVKLYIAPGFNQLTGVAAELGSIVAAKRGHAIIDAPEGTTVPQAIAGRGPAGDINFYTSNKRIILAYPRLKAYDAYTNANGVRPYSAYLAGVIAAVDYNEGYWVSPSNHEILGITGVETPITAHIADPSCEANQLNEVGITTLFSSFGTGVRTWGNRSAAWPTLTTSDNFISFQRTADVIHESIELGMLAFIDKPLNNATLESVVESSNALVRTLIGKGALLPGSKVFYDPAENTEEELAQGHVVFSFTRMSPVPMERITFKSVIDISLLKNLKPAA